MNYFFVLYRGKCFILQSRGESDLKKQILFNDFFVNNLPPEFEISPTISRPAQYLTEAELNALMFDQGYVLKSVVLPAVGRLPVEGAYTVLVYEDLFTGAKKYIASNSPPLDQNNTGRQSEGNHYIAVIPAQNFDQ